MKLPMISAVLGVLVVAGAGCATKRHVREALAPTQNQAVRSQAEVDALQRQVDQNREHIGDLDRRLATIGEKSADARVKSEDALKTARQAGSTAAEAAQRADTAGAAAQQATRDLARTNQRIGETVASLDNYHLAFSEKIYFGFNQAGLTREERSKLDAALRRLRGMKNYVVEVKGFADSSGSLRANRVLSRKRADSVVHYLVIERGIPLRSISELGAGADFPNADNQTPYARRLNRRVDLRIYSIDRQAPAASVADGSKP